MDVPDRKQITEMLRKQLQQVRHDLTDRDFESAAKLLEGYSCSDVGAVVREAVMLPLRQTKTSVLKMSANDIPPVELGHIKQAKKTVPPCATWEEINKLREWNQD